MRTLTCTRPGHFEYTETRSPEWVEGYSLLQIKRVGICGTDLHAYEGTQPFFSYPRILGHELSAEILVTDQPGFQKGDRVTIIPYFHCGVCIACRSGKPNCCVSINVCGVHIDGAMRDQLMVPSYSLVQGGELSHEELALVEPLAIGAHGVRRAGVMPGEYVLVVGAGPIGLGIMEFARIAGAKVIALDILESRLAFCSEKLKVDFVINAARENVPEKLKAITGNDMPAVVIDATGNLKAINQSFQWLAHGGRYVLVGLQKEMIAFSHPEFHKREATLMSSRNATRADFELVMNNMREGKVNPLNYITHHVAFEAVKDAFPGWLDPANQVIKAMAHF
jgi:2-desacetyl-2-hydroxyethyl bacteriochlorophyllide A dehydrogenase